MMTLLRCLLVTGCLSLAKIAAHAQEDIALRLWADAERDAAAWLFSGTAVHLVQDPVAGAPAWTPAGEVDPLRPMRPAVILATSTLRAPLAIEAAVRLPVATSEIRRGQYSRASIRVGWQSQAADGQEPEVRTLEALRGRSRDDVGYDAVIRRGSVIGTRRTFTPVYTGADISPLMDDSVRLILEQRIGQLPVAHERVYRLRMEVRSTTIRYFINGRLVDVESGSFDAGQPLVELYNRVHLLSVTVRPLSAVAEGWATVPLNDFFNASGPVNPPGLAAAPGDVAMVAGVPMITSIGAGGGDNLDLAPSVYLHRLGSMREGDAREAVHVPEGMDVTRFTMRVPEGTWRRAWVLAAADDDATEAPVLTVRFYTPRTPWTSDRTVTVPSYTATASDSARRLPWADGSGRALWLIPIELDAAALAVEPMTCLELTKAIHPWRGYPDPAYYGSYPGGLRSAVHVYGLTLEEAPLWARGTGERNANLYEAGETPVWRVLLRNLTAAPLNVEIAVTVTDPYGKVTTEQRTHALAADGEQHELRFAPATTVYGLHTVTTIVRAGDFEQRREGTFLKLAPVERQATGANSPWGLWCWNGGHDTNPDPEENLRLLRALGAINNFQHDHRAGPKSEPVSLYPLRQKAGVGAMHYRLVDRQMPAWSYEDPIDPAKYAAYAEEKGLEAAEALRQNPDLIYVNFFAENYLSLRLTHGMSPWAMGQPWFTLDEREAPRLRAHWLTAKAAVEGVRKHAPTLKVLFGHGAGNFAQPFFRLEDWDNDLFDGFGMDLPQFERMPERQPRATEPSLLFFLHHQTQEMGLVGKDVVHLESYFPSSGPLALTFDNQAASVVRTAVLSMALGTTRFMRTWELHTSGDGWGGSHYGSAGLIDRAPEFNPKPAAAAFATMTRILDLARYDGYLETGSRSAFCLRFADTDRLVYPVWTIRGTRPLRLTLDDGASVERIDLHGNRFEVAIVDGTASVELSSTPQWLVVRGGAIRTAAVGEPVYTAKPAPHTVPLTDFEQGDWTYDAAVYDRYQTNHWDMPREPGHMAHAQAPSQTRGSRVLRVELTDPDQNKPMVGFYGSFLPPAPIAIPGKATALGLWVNGHSGWNRFVYEIVDAKGETWLSCGTRDAWNCDDIHSWSSVNHDGWRYLRFPLPGNAPGDGFREPDTTWWGSDGDGIVDLPVTLTRIIVEMRPQMIYVNEMIPVDNLTLELDDLVAEYADETAMTQAPVVLQASAKLAVEGDLAALPNPHATLLASGVGAAPEIARVYPPEQINNGERLFVEVTPVEGAARYQGYVAAYADGRGAQALAIGPEVKGTFARYLDKPNLLFYNGLRPSRPMYLFVTVIDAEGRESKPSAIREVILKDEFPFK